MHCCTMHLRPTAHDGLPLVLLLSRPLLQRRNSTLSAASHASRSKRQPLPLPRPCPRAALLPVLHPLQLSPLTRQA